MREIHARWMNLGKEFSTLTKRPCVSLAPRLDPKSLVANNPTPDGKMPGESRCSPREIQNYLNRISGPLLDRIDIHVEVPAVKFREIAAEWTGETSVLVRERVVTARRRQ